MQKNIAIFASGSGTNTENIIQYFENHNTVNIALVISNKPDAMVLKRAEKWHVPTRVFTREDFSNGQNVIHTLKDFSIDYIILAGFLLQVPSILLKAYPQRIINIHPALLPKFGGKGMYGDHVHQAVVNAGETQSGITIHYINEEYDKGDIIFQATCDILPQDTPYDVAKKVHTLEYKYYPKVIENVICH